MFKTGLQVIGWSFLSVTVLAVTITSFYLVTIVVLYTVAPQMFT